MQLAIATLNLLAGIGRGAIAAVMPNGCVFCGVACGAAVVPMCRECHADLPWINTACSRCANPVAAELPPGVHCAQCQKNPPPFDAAVAPLRYMFPVDAAIKAMKFKRKLHYVPAFGYLLAVAMQRLPDDIDALLPVPLHWRRHAARGFNQAAEICKSLEKKTGLPIIRGVIRCRPTPYQSGLAASLRQRNLRSAFRVRAVIDARHVVIVDDVITTGATCRQVATTVLEAGARKVSVLAIARA